MKSGNEFKITTNTTNMSKINDIRDEKAILLLPFKRNDNLKNAFLLGFNTAIELQKKIMIKFYNWKQNNDWVYYVGTELSDIELFDYFVENIYHPEKQPT